MLGRKNICNCKSENYNASNISSSFFLFPKFNNKFAQISTNPRTTILKSGQADTLNTNRTNNNTCYTPFRVPYNQVRKSSSCNENCTSNEKIIKDTPSSTSLDADPDCASNACRRRNYASSRLVNKLGIRNHTYGSNYRNFLQFTGKLFTQNNAGLLPENKTQNINEYKIGTVNGTVNNINSNTVDNSLCKIGYIAALSTTNVQYLYNKIPTATKKYSNPKYGVSSSVSGRNRLARLKYNTILAGQQMRNGYNNCINGDIGSQYQTPGPNTKYRTETTKQISSRINGMKQSCCPPEIPDPFYIFTKSSNSYTIYIPPSPPIYKWGDEEPKYFKGVNVNDKKLGVTLVCHLIHPDCVYDYTIEHVNILRTVIQSIWDRDNNSVTVNLGVTDSNEKSNRIIIQIYYKAGVSQTQFTIDPGTYQIPNLSSIFSTSKIPNFDATNTAIYTLAYPSLTHYYTFTPYGVLVGTKILDQKHIWLKLEGSIQTGCPPTTPWRNFVFTKYTDSYKIYIPDQPPESISETEEPRYFIGTDITDITSGVTLVCHLLHPTNIYEYTIEHVNALRLAVQSIWSNDNDSVTVNLGVTDSSNKSNRIIIHIYYKAGVSQTTFTINPGIYIINNLGTIFGTATIPKFDVNNVGIYTLSSGALNNYYTFTLNGVLVGMNNLDANETHMEIVQ